ncbi:MAG TPA: arginine--tRNA ligase [Chloroflexota bacterium]|nr:arginine--tRNA ligase [Chloroflexota bacterium]
MSADPLADLDAEFLTFLRRAGVPESALESAQLSTPPQREFGARSSNVAFALARERRTSPRAIAQELAETFHPDEYRLLGRIEPAGAGFLNAFLNDAAFTQDVIGGVQAAGAHYGRRPDAVARRVVIEHTSVNPNKEWHIGHARNAVLGDVLVRTLRLAGDEVEVQNYIDDTGLQAAMSIVGLVDFPEPEQPDEKFDHYAGRLYVKIAGELGSEKTLKERLAELEHAPALSSSEPVNEADSLRARLENIARLQKRAVQVMHGLESGEYQHLVRQILDAQLLTAYRLGVFYNLLAWESDLVESHLFGDAIQRLEQSPSVTRPAEGRYAGALVIWTGQQSEEGEPRAEVLIRSNGLPTYVGKDIAYHMWKFHLVPNRLGYVPYAEEPNGETLWSTSVHGEPRPSLAPQLIINIIAAHQSQAQATVKDALRAAGFAEAAGDLVHLAYGLVKGEFGHFSGRAGTAVSADSVIDEAVRVAYDRVRERQSGEMADVEMRAIAEAVGVGAVRYFMVQYNPQREITFNVADVVSYDGNTALYIQYALVRMHAILRRATGERGIPQEEIAAANLCLLQHEQERRLIYHLALYPSAVADAARTLSVNLIAEYAFDLATIFSQFYRDCSVLDAAPELRAARLQLVATVRDVLANACSILGVPVIERL